MTYILMELVLILVSNFLDARQKLKVRKVCTYLYGEIDSIYHDPVIFYMANFTLKQLKINVLSRKKKLKRTRLNSWQRKLHREDDIITPYLL